MRIDSATIGMESNRSYKTSTVTTRRFIMSQYQGGSAQNDLSLNTALGGNTGSAADAQGKKADTKGTGNSVATMQEWQSRFQASSAGLHIRSSADRVYMDIQQQTVRYIFDLLFGSVRDRLSRWLDEDAMTSADGTEQMEGSASAENAGNQNAQTEPGDAVVPGTDGKVMFLKPRPLNIKVLNYSQETYIAEREDTSFSTVGTVKTADGREISFNVNVGMSREFEQYYREDLGISSIVMCDPLVINLDTDAASLSDQTFYFDIDADGEMDEVSQLNAGSGYLALDKNGDGQINDGNELFGTASGNGFADLAEYDEDGNGWIDENDEVWNKLKIWAKDENGKDVLYRLADKGVGAICLQNVSTDFTQKGQGGQTLGAIRNTGVFLYENGNVGTVQHVDLTKYEKDA